MKKRILILDDDVKLAIQWSRALESVGYTVFVTHGADDALKIFEFEEFDLCIVDFIVRENGKPVANGGISFLGQMGSAARKNIAIIGVSGLSTRDPMAVNAKQYLSTFGAEHYLSKPFSDEELIDTVTKILK